MLAMGALLTYAVSNFLLIGESDASRDLFVQFFEILVTFAPLLLLRAAPYEQGWFSSLRRYVGTFGEGLDPASSVLGADDAGAGADRRRDASAVAAGQSACAAAQREALRSAR